MARRRGVGDTRQLQQPHRTAVDAAAPAPGCAALAPRSRGRTGHEPSGRDCGAGRACGADGGAGQQRATRTPGIHGGSRSSGARKRGRDRSLGSLGRRGIPRGRRVCGAVAHARARQASAYFCNGNDGGRYGARVVVGRCVAGDPAHPGRDDGVAACGGRLAQREERGRSRGLRSSGGLPVQRGCAGPAGVRSGAGALAGEGLATRRCERHTDRRQLQREPRLGARGNRRACGSARPPLAGTGRHGRSGQPGCHVPQRSWSLRSAARHRGVVDGG